MAKVSEEARKKYQQKIREFRKSADDLLEREKHVHAIIKADDRGAEYKKLLLAEENMNLVSYYLIMDRLSVILLGVQNQNALNDAKRTYYKILKYLEEVFTDLIDVPFSDYEDALKMVEAFPEMKKYELIRKLGLTLDMMIDYYGENNRWKWAFVELRGRLGTLAKNCINLKKFVAGMDPRFDGFQQRIEHLHLTKRLLREAADNYRKSSIRLVASSYFFR